MANALLPTALWDLIEPLLPIPEDKPEGGRPRRSDRACLTGILFVLRSGIPWRMLPKELGCGSGMSVGNPFHWLWIQSPSSNDLCDARLLWVWGQ